MTKRGHGITQSFVIVNNGMSSKGLFQPKISLTRLVKTSLKIVVRTEFETIKLLIDWMGNLYGLFQGSCKWCKLGLDII